MPYIFSTDEIRAKVEPIAQEYGVERVMLFGSYARGEAKTFDTRPYLNSSVFFQELLDKSYFSKAFVSSGTIEWPNGQDFCPDTLYELGVPNQNVPADLPLGNNSLLQ